MKLAFAPAVADEIALAFGRRKVSQSPADGAVPGLEVVTLDEATAGQLLAVLAVALNLEVTAPPPAAGRP